ncbi:hypothetical protein [Oceanobacillus sojae]|uniref:hypothetical protein n=1 Tax=Oceanobacillus sojae TaxID=582851 RepID=UPI0009887AC4|nr:hypothetical protein [Oceanobacillus sojae]MCT1905394.1 hypothetical protein [Oceanobacillus sojae]
MGFLTGYLPIMIGIGAVLFLISIFLKEKRIVPPMVVSSLSLICIFLSYFFEGREESLIGDISLAAFISSTVVLILMVIISWTRTHPKNK